MMFTWPKAYQKELVATLNGNLAKKIDTQCHRLCYIRRGRAYIEIFARAFQSIAIISWLTTTRKYTVFWQFELAWQPPLLVPHSSSTSNVKNEMHNTVNLNKRKTCFPYLTPTVQTANGGKQSTAMSAST